MYVWMQVCTCHSMHAKIRGQTQVLVLAFHVVWGSLVFSHGVSQDSWPLSYWGFSCLYLSSPCRGGKITEMHSVCAYMGSRGLNSGLCGCVEKTLPTKPSPQTPVDDFLKLSTVPQRWSMEVCAIWSSRGFVSMSRQSALSVSKMTLLIKPKTQRKVWRVWQFHSCS